MPQWKTSKLTVPEGSITITHKSRHKPREIWNALSTEPIKTMGTAPIVSLHDYGAQQLAVRREDRLCPRFSPKNSFDKLLEMDRKKKAIVEKPFALIEAPDYSAVVTFYKKNTRPLVEFMEDPSIGIKLKEKACKSAMIQLAELHSTGVLHEHARPDNFVARKNGNAELVDYKILKFLEADDHNNIRMEGGIEARQTAQQLSQRMQLRYILREPLARARQRSNAFAEELMKVYQQALAAKLK